MNDQPELLPGFPTELVAKLREELGRELRAGLTITPAGTDNPKDSAMADQVHAFVRDKLAAMTDEEWAAKFGS